MDGIGRRWFLERSAILGAAGLSGASARLFGLERQNTLHARFPRQDDESVEAVVRFSHFSLERVTELVTARPELAKASWDWGYGDWETALGAASHTGNHGIAELLISHGAPPSLPSAIVLGQLDVVRALVAASPGIQSQPGPHSIPLLEHARLAGDRAKAVYDYLMSIGGADQRAVSAPFDGAARETFFGVYRFGPGADEYLEAYDQRGALMLRRGEQTGRALTHLGNHTFHPAGARSVRIVFAIEGGVPARVTVHDPDPIVMAVRDR